MGGNAFLIYTLGKAVGVKVKTPFLDDEFMEFAKKIDIKLKLNVKDGVKYGKWLIRKAYENLIPNEIIWRSKAPLEIGTGTTVLPKFFDGQVEDEYFEAKNSFIWKRMGLNCPLKSSFFITKYLESVMENPARSIALKKENSVRTVKPSWEEKQHSAEYVEPTLFERLMDRAGFEPATSAVRGRRSYRLNYRPRWKELISLGKGFRFLKGLKGFRC